MRTQVAIIGGGPSGLLLSQLLHVAGIESVVLERRTRDYVLGRIRAGVLERGTVDLLHEAGCGDRLSREGLVHDSVVISFDDDRIPIRFSDYIDRPVTVYGQTEVTRDLYDAREAAGGQIEFEVDEVALHDLETKSPHVTYTVGGAPRRIDCDFIAGCDGFHGVSRQSIPETVRREYDKVYDVGWLGVLSESPPICETLIYAASSRGFALCSMRNPSLSRYYIQCGIDERVEDWSDDAYWDELRQRVPAVDAENLAPGPVVEKSIAPLRSFVCEPMRFGQLFLCGDAAHIVPPTGAKGLNSAVADVHYLHTALRRFYASRDSSGLDAYSQTALARVWKIERFSWWLTAMLHHLPGEAAFDRRMKRAEFEFLMQNEAAQAAFTTNYVGLPY